MTDNRFSPEARRALEQAQACAKEFGHSHVGSEHLLLGLAREGGGAAELLLTAGLSADQLCEALRRCAGWGTPGSDPAHGLSEHARSAVECAAAEAGGAGSLRVETTHLLLGLLREGPCMARSVLTEAGGDAERLAAAVTEKLRQRSRTQSAAAYTPPSRETEIKSKLLREFTVDLTQAAEEGRLDPVLGRDAETERVMQILCRRTKNNPVLVGEPGVGKTAVVEELARRLVRGAAPMELLNRRILSLDLAALLAGTKFRGEFEDRVRRLIADAKKDSSALLFIDELHNIVGAGSAEGALDAANILKPALSRGELQIVGATTYDEYRRYIEKDAALERRFQPVRVTEPGEEATLAILRGVRGKYEAFHGVEISEEALEAAVRLARRYLSDRFFPDKAIDLMDEAASRSRLSRGGETEELRALEGRLRRLLREKEAARQRQDRTAVERYSEIESDFRRQLRASRRAVTAEDVAAVVSDWTGIPAQRLTADEGERLRALEERLRRRVVGQEEAVRAVAQAVRRSRMGLKDPRRPVGAFLFLGPTGVGKTELSRALAEELFGAEEALIRIDMSEYTDRGCTARLIGSPPGYIGHEEGGQLTEQIRRRPYSVVLFDEVEKAHEETWNLLLQILEDGRLTDGQGRTADFRSAVVILTSNVGTERAAISAFSPGFAMGGEEDVNRRLRAGAMEELRRTFRPEFLNRLDEILVFRALGKPELEAVAAKLLEQLCRRMEQIPLTLTAAQGALCLLAEKAYDPRYGARPLRRVLRAEVEDVIAEGLLSGTFRPGETLLLSQTDGALRLCAAEETAVAQ